MNIRDYWDFRSKPYKIYYSIPFLSAISHRENKKARKFLFFQPHSFRQRKILNIACGVNPLHPVSKSDTVVNIDLSMRMLRQNRENHSLLSLIQADTIRLPFRNESLSHIMVVGLSEYIGDINNWLIELKSILKPNGLLLITSTPDNFITRLRKPFNPPLYFHSLQKLRDIASKNELEILKQEKGFLQEITVFRKI